MASVSSLYSRATWFSTFQYVGAVGGDDGDSDGACRGVCCVIEGLEVCIQREIERWDEMRMGRWSSRGWVRWRSSGSLGFGVSGFLNREERKSEGEVIRLKVTWAHVGGGNQAEPVWASFSGPVGRFNSFQPIFEFPPFSTIFLAFLWLFFQNYSKPAK